MSQSQPQTQYPASFPTYPSSPLPPPNYGQLPTSQFTPQPNQVPANLPINLSMFTAIMSNSKYIPQATRNSYLSGLQKYERRSLLWTVLLSTYTLSTVVTRRTKWWRLTCNWRIVFNKVLLLMFLGQMNSLHQVRYHINSYKNHEGLLRQNWDNIMQQINMHANKNIMVFQDSNPINTQNNKTIQNINPNLVDPRNFNQKPRQPESSNPQQSPSQFGNTYNYNQFNSQSNNPPNNQYYAPKN